MHHPRISKTEGGGSVVDALIAIVLTSIVSGGVYIFLSAHTGRLFTNLKQDRDLMRFVSLTRDFEQRLELLYCDWWKQGIRYIKREKGVELHAENGDQIDVLRIETQEHAILLSGPSEKAVTVYHFEIVVPVINPVFDGEGRFSSIQLTYSESLKASLYLQSRPLHSRLSEAMH
ncbi:hypothetical protein S1OALGB6SA_878 [Olavius algarvensis spirochete endosymbiont]|uniref:hypothetical protein n=1 Tax=Olavius algarvensis spirochete endosymbiont TaxID=260710 RepID=UPI000F2A069F|nr:hypothetical protein [Olavius algarvensis spirochete endosymbiont]VDA99805.1 hypothetical protein S1OALGB6SA_878 [Olavius algarvensis spirochete endosymbiont]